MKADKEKVKESNSISVKLNIGGQLYERKLSIEKVDNYKRMEMFDNFSNLVDKMLAKYVPKKKSKEK